MSIPDTALTDDLVTQIIAASQWEQAFAKFLAAERGWHVLPTCDLHGNYAYAPHFASAAGDLIVPDLLAARDGEMKWFEVKHKSHADWHRNSHQYVTGLPAHHWDAYLRVQELTHTDVVIVFIHAEEGLVVGGTLKELTAHISHRYTQSLMDKEGTLFFKFDALPRLIATARLQKYMEAHS